MDDDLIAAHRDLPQLAPQLHLPVQSGSDRILEAMNRRHTRADYLRTIERLRDARPDLALTSDFIVGFPGETEGDFADTLRIVDEVGYAGAFSFKYSPRPGTPGATMRNQVAEDVKSERLARLQAAINRHAERLQRALPRAHLRCADGKARPPPWPAHRPLAISPAGAGHGAVALIGTVVPVTITGTIGQQPVRRAREHAANRGRIPSRSISLAAWSLKALRNLPTDNGLAPAASEANDTATTQIVLTFDDNRRASTLFGQYGQNLALIERRLGVVADSRGNQVTIEGSRDGCERARRVLEGLYEQIKRGHDLSQGDVEGAIRLVIAQGSLFDFDPATSRSAFEEINLRKRPVRARTSGQDAYMRALKRHALVFGIGPAGTGKTWLAVAHAVALFERKEVDRIVLSRPGGRGRRAARLPAGRHAREGRSLSAADLRRAVRPDGRAHRGARDAERRDRDRAARLHARPHALERRGHPRRGAEHDLDADEDVSDAPWRERPHDRERRSEPDRPAVGPDVGALPRRSGCSPMSKASAMSTFTKDDVVRHELVARIVEAYDDAAAAKARGRPMSRDRAACRLIDVIVELRPVGQGVRRRGRGAARARPRPRSRSAKQLHGPHARGFADR